MAASESTLGSLHVLVAQILKDRIGDKEVCTAADVNAAIKFLKDNNITCAPGKDNHVGELQDELDKAAAENAADPVQQEDLRLALEEVERLSAQGRLQ